MYGNSYPNDYENKNVVDGAAKEVKPENGNFSGQNTTGYHTGYHSADGRQDASGAGNSAGAGSGAAGNGSYHYGRSYGAGSGNMNGGSPYGSGSSGNAYGGNTYGSGVYGSAYQPPKKVKKERTGGGYWKKALVAVSLGLLFGLCAGAGFYAVESATGFLEGSKGVEASGGAVQQAEVIREAGNQIADAQDSLEDTNTPAGSINGSAVVMDVSTVVSNVMPAIVSINNTYTQTMSYFGQTLQSEGTGVGSGIIVGENDSELLIVSNYHVVEDADKLVVQFADGSEAEAQMKGSDAEMDLAVIAVSMDDIEADTKETIAVAALGDSDSLTVGEPAIAIGNALGYGQSVTTGVVSALDRVINLSQDGTVNTDADGPTFIQTDAAINPGNSGGALLNLKGEVIGINSNKIGGSVVEGMGYAIPISAAKPIIEDLMLKQTREKVSEDQKGYLGISPLTVVDDMAEAYGMPKGVYVSQVYEGTGAAEAGIVKGNIITEFDGNKITSSEDLLRVMEYYSVGDSVEITVMQGSPNGWESRTVTVVLGEKFD